MSRNGPDHRGYEGRMRKGFKHFVPRGNVVDLSVAVVMGAFRSIVTAFTEKPPEASPGAAEGIRRITPPATSARAGQRGKEVRRRPPRGAAG